VTGNGRAKKHGHDCSAENQKTSWFDGEKREIFGKLIEMIM